MGCHINGRIRRRRSMVGDVILWCRAFIKQQTCIHRYNWINRKDNGGSFELCIKCDKIK